MTWTRLVPAAGWAAAATLLAGALGAARSRLTAPD